MRASLQKWNSVVARLEVVIAGIGQVGLAPTTIIQRVSDGLFLAAGGGAWGGAAFNAMVAVDAVNLPGHYEYVIPAPQLEYDLGRQGYRIKVVEAVNAILEYEHVSIEAEFSGEVDAGLAAAGAAGSVTLGAWAPGVADIYTGMLVTIIDGLGAGQTRLISDYSAGRVADVSPTWITAPDVTSLCVVHAAGRVDLAQWLGSFPLALAAQRVVVDVDAWIGAAPSPLIAGRVDVDVGEIQATPRDAIVDYVWDEPTTGHGTPGTAGRDLELLFGGIVLATGLVVVSAGTTTDLDAGTIANADYYVGARLVIAAGTGTGQERVITAYTAGRVATHLAWDVNPDGTSTYEIQPARAEATSIAGAVWDEARAAHVAGGTFGEGVLVQSVNGGGIVAASFAAGAIDAAAIGTNAIDADAIATDAFGALELAAGAAAEIADAIWDEPMVAHNTIGTGGDHLRRMLSLRQSNVRVVYDTWTAGGQPTHGMVYIYDSKADLEADADPWPLATGSYEFDGVYDASNRLTDYTSTREA